MPGLVLVTGIALGYDLLCKRMGWETICSGARRVGRFSQDELEEAAGRDLTGLRRATVAGILFGLTIHVVLDGDW